MYFFFGRFLNFILFHLRIFVYLSMFIFIVELSWSSEYAECQKKVLKKFNKGIIAYYAPLK